MLDGNRRGRRGADARAVVGAPHLDAIARRDQAVLVDKHRSEPDRRLLGGERHRGSPRAEQLERVTADRGQRDAAGRQRERPRARDIDGSPRRARDDLDGLAMAERERAVVGRERDIADRERMIVVPREHLGAARELSQHEPHARPRGQRAQRHALEIDREALRTPHVVGDRAHRRRRVAGGDDRVAPRR